MAEVRPTNEELFKMLERILAELEEIRSDLGELSKS